MSMSHNTCVSGRLSWTAVGFGAIPKPPTLLATTAALTHSLTHTNTHTRILLDVVVVVRVRPTHTFKRTYLHIRCQCPSIPHRRRLNCVCPLKERPKMKVLSLVRRQPSNVRPLASLKICSWHEHMWRNFVADFCSLTGQGDCVHCNKIALFST